MNSRKEVLRDLLDGSRPIQAIVQDLKQFEWDSRELVVLTRRHVSAILAGYVTTALAQELLVKVA